MTPVPPPPNEKPPPGKTFVRFKARKYERGFMVEAAHGQWIEGQLNDPECPRYLIFRTVFGGQEYVRLDHFHAVELIHGT